MKKKRVKKRERDVCTKYQGTIHRNKPAVIDVIGSGKAIASRRCPGGETCRISRNFCFCLLEPYLRSAMS